MKVRRLLSYFGVFILAISLIVCLVIWGKFRDSLPQYTGTVEIHDLDAPVLVESDRFGIPIISAESRLDAFRVLGYLIARDRLFQVDLMRRKSAGRLAELFGKWLVKTDIRQRYLGLHRIAPAVVKNLPEQHRKVLEVFAEGFNDFLNEARTLPFEFMVLGYAPEQWTPEDSILVAMTMFQDLTLYGDDERMLTVMKAALPPKVMEFFTPDSDQYDTVLIGGGNSHRAARPIPVAELAALPVSAGLFPERAGVDPDAAVLGSNGWAVASSKTADGRAILANDMHLGLAVPNIWYRAMLRYDGSTLSGVVLPGLPLLIAGTNEKVAWGHTNLMADVIDLVSLDINPDNASDYLTLEGWKPFKVVREIVQVKDGDDEILEINNSIWGPVSPKSLMGKPVSYHWTGLQADAINLEMLNLDRVSNLEQAITLFKRAGSPPTNIMLADDKGRIGWTLAGKFPRRFGFDGTISRSWSQGEIGWQGFLGENELPSLLDPPSAILATANNRTLGSEYPFVIGHNYVSGFRVSRIIQRLRPMNNIQEEDMLKLQLDTHSEFYEFYRNLALTVLEDEAISENQELIDILQIIENWDGKADLNSKGLTVLIEFRRLLALTVLTPYFQVCRDLEPSFIYRWYKMDTPLRLLLTERIEAVLPSRNFDNWEHLILETLRKSARRVKKRFEVASLNELSWQRSNLIKILHPFSRTMPFLSRFLDMPVNEVSGCSYCIKVLHKSHGASQRMVISPGKPEDGIFHMPGGQSGHPFSIHYRDQHPYWVTGTASKFNPGPVKNTQRFVPSEK